MKKGLSLRSPRRSGGSSKSSGRRLLVEVIEGQGLVAVDRSGTSDPYAKVNLLNLTEREISGEQQKTNKHSKNLNPQWKERMTFGDTWDLNNVDSLPILRVQVWDHDRIGRDNPMGEVKIELTSIDPNGAPTQTWYPLQHFGDRMQNLSGQDLGRVHLKINFSGPPRERLSSDGGIAEGAVEGKDEEFDIGASSGEELPQDENGEEKEPNCLHVTVIQARGLRIMDRNFLGGGGSSDPLVVLRVDSERRKTTTMKKNLEPKWNEKFELPVSETHLSLNVTVEDSDTVKNDFMGMVDIPLLPFHEGKSSRRWYTLKNQSGAAEAEGRGQIELRIKWKWSADAVPKKRGIMSRIGGKMGIGEESSEDAEDADEAEEEKSAEELEKEAEEAKEAQEKLKAELGDIQIKSGDYQVQVHIIEARDLKGEDLSGLSDPVTYIELFGQKQNTGVKKQCLSCVWDEVFIFNLRNLDKQEFEFGQIKISVMDADTLSRNDLIGSYMFDATYVYFQQNHEIYRKWVALIDDEDKDDNGIQGYLKLSVTIIGPGEKLPVHDEEAEKKKEQEKEKSGDIASMVMMPPAVPTKTAFLVTTIHRAEHLPQMDGSFGGLTKGGVDAYFQCEFAGNKPCKSRVRKMQGARTALNPVFSQELWVPVTLPTMTANITYSMWDWDRANPNECIAHVYESFSLLERLPNKRRGPFWCNLYGGPFGQSGPSLKKISSVVPGLGFDYKEFMNKYPEHGSTYRGRFLMSQRIEEEDEDGPHDKGAVIDKRKVKKLKRQPPVEIYKLRAQIISGTELPKFRSVTNMGKFSKMQVRVSIGINELLTARVENRDGVSEWYETKESEELHLPSDAEQIPDIFVHLCKGKQGKDATPICFARFKAKDLLAERFEAEPYWQMLEEDKAIDALEDGEFPGSVLLRLVFGTVADAERSAPEWQRADREMTHRQPYQLRCHIYQARELPATDSNGLMDPYLWINFLGQKKKIEKQKKTVDPLWYQTVSFDCTLPPMRYAPQVNIQVWDWDMFDSNDYAGCFFFNVKDAFTMDSHEDSGDGTKLPDPQWFDLLKEKPGDSEGQVLASFELIPKSSPDMRMPPSPDIVPVFRDSWIEIIALGCRDLKPYNFLPIGQSFLEFEIDSFTYKTDKTTGKKEPNKEKRKESTNTSKRPSGNNPNFLVRIVMDVKMPVKAIFAPPLKIRAKDVRMGGFSKPVIGHASIDMVSKLPWSKTYVKPQADKLSNSAVEAGVAAAELGADAAAAEEGVEETKDGADGTEETKDAGGDEEKAAAEAKVASPAPENLDALIREKVGAEDTGAGVFGALLHVQDGSSEDAEKRRKKAARAKKKAEGDGDDDSDSEEEEEEEPKYLKGRLKEPAELEETLQTSPFEKYELHLGNKHASMFGQGYRTTGIFKGLIRVLDSKDDPPPFDLDELLKPQAYKVRLYVLRGLGFVPMDMGIGGRPGKSDPYMKIKLGGKTLHNDRKNFIEDVTEPDFYKCFEMGCELPGATNLEIMSMDYDDIGSDDLIGRTRIDLEDRLFHEAWRKLGKENRNDDIAGGNLRWDTKPIERRSLYIPTNNAPQGTLECWLDIMTPGEASTFEPDDVALPPTKTFEVRLVIWKTKDVVSMDTFTDMNDLYVKAWIEGCDPQETDVHWRCKKGKGSFNWRLKFNVELGHNTRSMKFPYVHFQMWDKDIVSWNDCIAEGMINVEKQFRKAYKKDKEVKLFEKPPDKKKRAEMKAAKEAREAAEAANMEKDVPDPADEEKQGLLADADASNAVGDIELGTIATSASKESGAGDGAEVAAKGQAGDSDSLLADAKSDANEEDDSGTLLFKGTKISKKKKTKSTSNDADAGDADAQEAKAQAADGDDDSEVKEFINSLKEMSGLYDMDPPDSSWLDMSYLIRNKDGTQTHEPRGKLCVSMTILPKEKAEVNAVGFGRADPNHSPFLPPPVGRMKFSLNPFSMFKELLGPAICGKLMCCLFCVGIMLLLIFCQPLLNLLIAVTF